MTDWQPIETAPKDFTRILVCWASKHGRMMNSSCSIVYWAAHAEKWVDERGGYWGGDYSPTHWMPIPPPPKETA